jgi:hypothetical protein
MAFAFAFWWLAQIAVENPHGIALRRAFIGLAAQTSLTSLTIVVYYAFLDRAPISNQLSSSARWITIGSFFISLGTVIAMVGYFLMLRALPGVPATNHEDTSVETPHDEAWFDDE